MDISLMQGRKTFPCAPFVFVAHSSRSTANINASYGRILKLLFNASSFDMIRQLSRSNFHFVPVLYRMFRHLWERLVAGQLGARCTILCRVTVLGLRWLVGIRLCAVTAATHPEQETDYTGNGEDADDDWSSNGSYGDAVFGRPGRTRGGGG
jgi:hypothetical protein